MKKSLAGTGKRYVKVQGRLRGDADLHIQGAGPEVNRSYGVAVDIPKSVLSEGLWDWLKGLDTPLGSLHPMSGQAYFVMQVRPEGDSLHFQVEKNLSDKLNRGYGATFDIPLWTRPALEKFYYKTKAQEDC